MSFMFCLTNLLLVWNPLKPESWILYWKKLLTNVARSHLKIKCDTLTVHISNWHVYCVKCQHALSDFFRIRCFLSGIALLWSAFWQLVATGDWTYCCSVSFDRHVFYKSGTSCRRYSLYIYITTQRHIMLDFIRTYSISKRFCLHKTH